MLANNSKARGVHAKGPHRIQYDFMLDGVRYRPTLPHIPGMAPNSITKGAPESARVTQSFGSLAQSRIGLAEAVRAKSIAALNRLLAHTMALRDLYKKAHWQTSGPGFYELHLLFDKHHGEQVDLMDVLAERVQLLGGVALALAHDVVEETRIARAPRGRESAMDQLRRLLDAHEIILSEARPLAREASERGDEGSNDLIVGELVRTNELQSWFVAEHLVAEGASR